jgi:hypothetical protein
MIPFEVRCLAIREKGKVEENPDRKEANQSLIGRDEGHDGRPTVSAKLFQTNLARSENKPISQRK